MHRRNKPRAITPIVAALSGIFAVCLTPAARAGELDGAWANDKEVCDKIFTRANGRLVLAQDADLHGSGFVIDGTAIRGKLATCKIRSTTKNKNKIHILATCATDIMLSDTKFDLTIGADGELIRSFPGMPEMTVSYHRCPAPQ